MEVNIKNTQNKFKKKERVLCEVYGKLIIAILISSLTYKIKKQKKTSIELL